MGLAVSLTPILGKPRAHEVAVYDLEWDPDTYDLKLAGFYDGERYYCFDTIEDLLNHTLQRKYRNHWIYAHAGGLADMNFLLQKIASREGLHCTAAFSGSSAIVVKMKWRGKNGKDKPRVVTFLDSYWLLRDKLKHLEKFTDEKKDLGTFQCPTYPACGHVGRACDSAPSCGCEVGPQPICMFYKAPFSVLRDYNERDCKILYQAVSKFQDTLQGMGTELRSTIASTALGLFRTRYLKSAIETHPGLNDTLRASYIASRVEIFRPVAGAGVKGFDVNSMFPRAMLEPLPGEYLGQSLRIPDTDAPYFARCDVLVPDMYLPPLGARGRDERIYFPTGRWSGLFARPDLELLETVGGRIERVREAFLFHAFQDLRDYALDLYKQRAAAKKAGQDFFALILKFLLNSCYGKFAERREKNNLIINPWNEECPHNDEHTFFDRGQMRATCIEHLFPGAILLNEEKAVAHEHVAISSYITSLARRMLYQHMAPCGEDLYYCDTDSIWTKHDLPTGPELGELKLEYTIVKGGRFVQPKLYEIDDKVKSKGFSRLTPSQFQELVSGAEVRVERMYRVKEIARELRRFGPKSKTFGKKIQLGGSRPKRRHLADGSTEPWTYEETQTKWRSA
jgi:hypothetical protein